jgi:hypothetical protein
MGQRARLAGLIMTLVSDEWPSSMRRGLVTLPCDARARSTTPKQTLALVRAACHHRAVETPAAPLDPPRPLTSTRPRGPDVHSVLPSEHVDRDRLRAR